jgi:hypothetical protein
MNATFPSNSPAISPPLRGDHPGVHRQGDASVMAADSINSTGSRACCKTSNSPRELQRHELPFGVLTTLRCAKPPCQQTVNEP